MLDDCNVSIRIINKCNKIPKTNIDGDDFFDVKMNEVLIFSIPQVGFMQQWHPIPL